MLPNTTVAFIAAGVSLWLQRAALPSDREKLAARALAVLVLLVGGLTYLERVVGWDFGIDRLLFLDLVEQHPYRPLGRMATNSTVAFIFAGLALLTLDVRWSLGARPANWFGTLGLAVASMALVGHLYGAQSMYRFDSAAAMALCTTVAFVALHTGILFARASSNGLAVVLSESAGGVVARRMVVAIIVVPLVMGWLMIKGREQNLVGREVGYALLVVTVVSVLLGIALRVAFDVQHGEVSRQLALERASRAREEAERANRAKDDFLAVMSHELRTPLNAIIGYGSLLSQGVPDQATDGQQMYLQRIGASARHLLVLIEDVLALSHITIADDPASRTPVRVADVCAEAAAMAETQARAKGLDFEVQLPPETLGVITDPNKARQALLNLLGNAVKFTARGRVGLGVRTDARWVYIDVQDTGPGIAPAHLERVFESFWQVDQGPTRRAGGVGLGLHVTRQLATLLGGDVSVQSTVGEGSTFTLALPRYESSSGMA